ncbi:hypothetical protein QOT17_002420 [Balamuthia mandrillaris]
MDDETCLQLHKLPSDVLLEIFSKLSLPDLLSASHVCKHFQNVSSDNSLWKPFFQASEQRQWWEPYQPCYELQRPVKERNYRKEFLLKQSAINRWLCWARFYRVADHHLPNMPSHNNSVDDDEDENNYILNHLQQQQQRHFHNTFFTPPLGWLRSITSDVNDNRGIPYFSSYPSSRFGASGATTKVQLRALLVGTESTGKNTLSAALAAAFPDLCTSLEYSGEVGTTPTIPGTRGAGLWGMPHLSSSPPPTTQQEQRKVGGTVMKIGPLPLEVQTEVADLLSLQGSTELVRLEWYENVRPAVIVIVFSLLDLKSYNSIEKKIMPAIRCKYNDLPIVLVGTHLDRRQRIMESPPLLEDQEEDAKATINVSAAIKEKGRSSASSCVTWTQGIQLCKRIGGRDYVECSSLNGQGTKSLLLAITHLGVRHMLSFFSRLGADTEAGSSSNDDSRSSERTRSGVVDGKEKEGEEEEEQREGSKKGIMDTEPLEEVHEKIVCDGCNVGPIVGPCYRCTVCKDFHFCQRCHKKQQRGQLEALRRQRGRRDSASLMLLETNTSNKDEDEEEEEEEVEKDEEPLLLHNVLHSFVRWRGKKRRRRSKDVHAIQTLGKGFRHRRSVAGEEDEKEDKLQQEQREERSGGSEQQKAAEEPVGGIGDESFRRTGLDQSWRSAVNDVFRMFSKSSPSSSPPYEKEEERRNEIEVLKGRRKKKRLKVDSGEE